MTGNYQQRPQPQPFIALLLLSGAAYGYTLLGTEKAFWGGCLLFLALLKIRTIINGAGSLIWFGMWVLVFFSITWAINGKSSAGEAFDTLKYLLAFPALLLLGYLLGGRGSIYRIWLKFKRWIRS